jgi:hypothetical protein
MKQTTHGPEKVHFKILTSTLSIANTLVQLPEMGTT